MILQCSSYVFNPIDAVYPFFVEFFPNYIGALAVPHIEIDVNVADTLTAREFVGIQSGDSFWSQFRVTSLK